jgi:uncharacterized protein (TIGR00645 family)
MKRIIQHQFRVLKHLIHQALFESKWVLPLFYIGLVIALVIYGLKFTQDVWHLVTNFQHTDSEEVLILLLHLVDMAMIANLIKMVVTGSYNSFVEKPDHKDGGEHFSSGALKVKMATSLCVVGGINLLPLFLKPNQLTNREAFVKMLFFLAFLLLARTLSQIEKEHAETKEIELKHEKATPSGPVGFNAHR